MKNETLAFFSTILLIAGLGGAAGYYGAIKEQKLQMHTKQYHVSRCMMLAERIGLVTDQWDLNGLFRCYEFASQRCEVEGCASTPKATNTGE